MSMAILKPKGVLWGDLSEAERIEVSSQIKNITADPNYVLYKYYKTKFGKWIICNAFAVPMALKKSVWV